MKEAKARTEYWTVNGDAFRREYTCRSGAGAAATVQPEQYNGGYYIGCSGCVIYSVTYAGEVLTGKSCVCVGGSIGVIVINVRPTEGSRQPKVSSWSLP